MTVIALTIAGSDSSGGAGIQADLKTFSALGVYGASVITALTAQNTEGVSGVHAVPAAFVRDQMDAVLSDLDVKAVKTGMLFDANIIEAVAGGIRTSKLVVDPVMVATSGDALLRKEAVSALRDKLVPASHLITPNMDEAAILLGCERASGEEEMCRQAEQLVSAGAKAVLITGGHMAGDEIIDVLHDGQNITSLKAARIHTKNTHGTGCTISAAITAYLAKGKDLRAAVSLAKKYVTGALQAADELEIGSGHGPVHHFYEFWRKE